MSERREIFRPAGHNRLPCSRTNKPHQLRSHASRTVSNSAAFLLPHLQPHFHLLDIGCGPGTITSGFCTYLPSGHVTGLDASDAVVASASSLHPPSSYPNLTFTAGDILSPAGLPFAAASFDVIYTSQTLLHIPDHAAALREIRRLLKPDGIYAAREADSFHWTPHVRHFNDAMSRMLVGNACAPMPVGRAVHKWSAEAGFERRKMIVGAGATCYASEEERKWWNDQWVDRLAKGSEYRRQIVDSGTTEEEVEEILQDLRLWEQDEDGWFAVLQSEVICRK